MKKLWVYAGIWLGVLLASYMFFLEVTGSDGDANDIVNVVGLIMSIVWGVNGNDWRCGDLLSRGFAHISTFDALNRESAISKFYWSKVEEEKERAEAVSAG